MTPPIQEMTKYSGERSENDEMAPELHNSEQIDRASQAQHVAKQAKEHRHKAAGGTESRKAHSPGVDNVAGNESDMVDEMRDMEESGDIDNGAYEGEPNHDDNTSKYS